MRNLDDWCCNSGSMNCADGDTFSITKPGLSVPKVGGIACAVRNPRKAIVAAKCSCILDKLMMISKVFAKVETIPRE